MPHSGQDKLNNNVSEIIKTLSESSYSDESLHNVLKSGIDLRVLEGREDVVELNRSFRPVSELKKAISRAIARKGFTGEAEVDNYVFIMAIDSVLEGHPVITTGDASALVENYRTPVCELFKERALRLIKEKTHDHFDLGRSAVVRVLESEILAGDNKGISGKLKDTDECFEICPVKDSFLSLVPREIINFNINNIYNKGAGALLNRKKGEVSVDCYVAPASYHNDGRICLMVKTQRGDSNYHKANINNLYKIEKSQNPDSDKKIYQKCGDALYLTKVEGKNVEVRMSEIYSEFLNLNGLTKKNSNLEDLSLFFLNSRLCIYNELLEDITVNELGRITSICLRYKQKKGSWKNFEDYIGTVFAGNNFKVVSFKKLGEGQKALISKISNYIVDGRQIPSIKDLLDELEPTLRETTDLEEFNKLLVRQPRGKQQKPDYLLFNDGKVIFIEAKTSEKDDKITFNSIPYPYGMYLFQKRNSGQIYETHGSYFVPPDIYPELKKEQDLERLISSIRHQIKVGSIGIKSFVVSALEQLEVGMSLEDFCQKLQITLAFLDDESKISREDSNEILTKLSRTINEELDKLAVKQGVILDKIGKKLVYEPYLRHMAQSRVESLSINGGKPFRANLYKIVNSLDPITAIKKFLKSDFNIMRDEDYDFLFEVGETRKIGLPSQEVMILKSSDLSDTVKVFVRVINGSIFICSKLTKEYLERPNEALIIEFAKFMDAKKEELLVIITKDLEKQKVAERRNLRLAIAS